ncbi:MAG: M20/M25/M40 family metallo-hydrolase [Chloroflexi bacterium]|nr:M20/M25/M40 family metallo-hydrolase [Chloroflexota bacterium]
MLTPVELLQHLIRIDTTNPPGNEAVLIDWVAGLLRENGIEPTIVGLNSERTNLFARIKGRGEAPPLLLYGHVDVVTTADQTWTHPPFCGDIIEGYIWGRGALDMKGGDAMLISAFLRAKSENLDLPGDLILCLGADEEVGGAWGVKYLVEEHADLFGGAKVCLSEFGAFPLYLAGKRFYPIMVTERYVHSLKATIRGAGGHGAMRQTGTAMGRLGRLLSRLEGARLPVHITPVVKALVEGIAAALDEPAASGLRALLDPASTNAVLDQLDPAAARLFDPLLHNTVNPTIVSGGHKINVIPSEIILRLDGRVLPGIAPEDFVAEVRALIDDDSVLLEPNEMEPPAALRDPDMAHFQMLADVLRAADPTGIPVPYMVSGATDARVLAQLGIQTYGFLPMNLPPDFNFASTIHAADERIPVGAVGFGADAIYEAIRRYR